MKKRIAISVDDDLYEGLKMIPRGVSLSDVASFFFKVFLAECQKGGELTDKEFDDLFSRTPEDQALRLRIRKYVKPETLKMEKFMDSVSERLVSKRRVKKQN